MLWLKLLDISLTRCLPRMYLKLALPSLQDANKLSLLQFILYKYQTASLEFHHVTHGIRPNENGALKQVLPLVPP